MLYAYPRRQLTAEPQLNSEGRSEMKSKTVNKDQWVQIFSEIGMNEETMKNWHRAFEKRNPEGHQEFLEWLGIPSGEIPAIRAL